MEALLQILSHIPAWVEAVLLYGIIMGVRAMFARRVSLVAVTLIPLLFLGLSLTSLASAIRSIPVLSPVWAAGIGLGLLGGLTILSATILDPNAGPGRLKIAGSPMTLILFLLVFTTKFYYGMRIAMDPSASHNMTLVSVVLALSSMSTGAMIGRVWKLYAAYFGRGGFAAAK